MDLMQDIIARAKADKQRIVLPEGTEERTLKAADRLLADGVADIILIGNPAEIKELAAGFGLNHIGEATLVDPKNHEKKAAYADLLFQLRQKKGMTPEKAAVLVEDPLFLACLMIKAGDADGEIAGAENTTGNVLRPALQIIKTAPERGRVGSIAVATAATARNIVGVEPRVAMLSFSTKGSASHEMVDKVVEATRLAKEMAPDLKIDGELQADAALVEAVGSKKAPGSEIAGKANVLVFPTLEVGNIAYKLVQRLGGAEAVGPILQGMAAPVNDLSRGCSVDDIYKMVAIACNQSIGLKSAK